MMNPAMPSPMPRPTHRTLPLLPSALLALAALLAGCHGAPKVAPSLQQDAYDDAPYARVLAGSVRRGLVDYAAIRLPDAPDGVAKKNRAAADPDALDVQLDIYLDTLARFGPETTPDQFPTEADRLAYHLNAYNAVMLRKWLDSGARTAEPGDKVQWLIWFTLDRWKIDGRSMTLDGLEQRLIRPTYHEPRAHAALVCGAIDCPPLRDEPFRGPELDAQLDDQMRTWLNDPAENAIEINDRGKVRLAKILGWYREDFEEPKSDLGGLAGVMRQYLDDADPRKRDVIRAIEENRVGFQGYDWSINLAPPAAGAGSKSGSPSP